MNINKKGQKQCKQFILNNVKIQAMVTSHTHLIIVQILLQKLLQYNIDSLHDPKYLVAPVVLILLYNSAAYQKKCIQVY